ncbi:hypothetical protein I9018_18585 [Pseudomonas sp. MPFS]|uniref:hypothetical protein n=1 Tax=Pseudomonas sp. MPFS TaxID=2795724 RepID=UPI001F1316B0|nr:hypothetical protein [Pseudomonas sp. MPFS]UMZ09541.1 hypothetical protein I9018_18585 [Pseudomonas sp. MPFS]
MAECLDWALGYRHGATFTQQGQAFERQLVAPWPGFSLMEGAFYHGLFRALERILVELAGRVSGFKVVEKTKHANDFSKKA